MYIYLRVYICNFLVVVRYGFKDTVRKISNFLKCEQHKRDAIEKMVEVSRNLTK